MTYNVFGGMLNPTLLLLLLLLSTMADWLSNNVLALINIVALRRARLLLGWVIICRYTILVFNQAIQVYSAWPSSEGRPVSTGDGLGHR